MNKYKNRIPRDDLKRFAKEIAKKLVASDFKAGRVKDPTKIEERQQKKVKEFCKQFFEKAYQKHKKHELEKTARDKGSKPSAGGERAASPAGSSRIEEASPEIDDEDVKMSDVDEEGLGATPSAQSPSESHANGTLKRKRLDGENVSPMHDEEDFELTGSPSKRMNLETHTSPPPPPPPPAPPIETPPSGTPREAEAEAEGDLEMETDIYADSNFKSQSMADVLAQAQEEDDNDMDSGGAGDGDDLATKNSIGVDPGLENPLVDQQPQEATMSDGQGGQ
jgi:histone-lysine N-methyltransferase SETD2